MSQSRKVDFRIRNRVRKVLGEKFDKISEIVMRDGSRVIKWITLAANNKFVYVTKEMVVVDGVKHWRNIGMSMAA